MVCKKCEKNLTTVAAPDPFKPSSSTRKIGENKLLTAKSRASPYAKPTNSGGVLNKGKLPSNRCVDCKVQCQQNGAMRCQKCSYKKGLCAICGVSIMDTSRFKMSVK